MSPINFALSITLALVISQPTLAASAQSPIPSHPEMHGFKAIFRKAGELFVATLAHRKWDESVAVVNLRAEQVVERLGDEINSELEARFEASEEVASQSEPPSRTRSAPGSIAIRNEKTRADGRSFSIAIDPRDDSRLIVRNGDSQHFFIQPAISSLDSWANMRDTDTVYPIKIRRLGLSLFTSENANKPAEEFLLIRTDKETFKISVNDLFLTQEMHLDRMKREVSSPRP